MSFVHLHLHTQYSLLDGAIQAKELAQKVAGLKMPGAAMTDHGNLFGAIEFYLAMKEQGVKPIIGCEVYMAPGSRFEKVSVSGREPLAHHLVLLAQNETGYRNLCRIVTAGYFEGFYYKPRVDMEILGKWNEGLIALSGCIRGEIPAAFRRNRPDLAKQKAIELSTLFPDRFYLELQRNSCAGMLSVSNQLLNLADELKLPMVATNDCHYLEQDQAQAHDVLLCIQTGKTVDDEKRLRFEGEELFLKSSEEMRKLFSDMPAACDRTLEIAERCNVELKLGQYHFPKYVPPENLTLEQALENRATASFETRLKLTDENRQAYRNRLQMEIQTIQSMGFAGYFLIVADFVNFARRENIPVGPGRGSAAGSLVAYCLGITDIDPMPYGLLFERFLNPERISMPDIDMDFCIRGRDRVIKYVQETYGSGEHHQVAQIITFGKMQAKAVIRDVGRALNMPYADCDRIAKMVPNVLNITLSDALEQEPKLKKLVDEEAQVGRLMDLALNLEGLARHASIHAAGVVMTDGPLVNFLPLYKGAEGEVVTQYDMNFVEKLGLIKFDFLGLKTLTYLDDAAEIIRKRFKADFDLAKLPVDDAKVYDQLSTGDTLGVFQLESGGMRDLITKLRPNTFEDLIALVALYRPGPLGSGMVDDFIKRKHGKATVKYPLPQLENILRNTYGIIVYQEQVMQIAAALANYTMGEADLLRRAMGKKKPEEMAKQKDRFLKGAVEKQIPSKESEAIFELMAKFAEYGFNKSHSAAYALIAYQTAYVKTHFPHAFMASLLNSEKENTDKIFVYMHDCRAHGIAILPPDVNESDRNFTVTPENQIRFGISAVKNVGEAAVDAILEARKSGGAFTDFVDFCTRVDLKRVNRRVCESLIMCGAFDFSGDSRATLADSLDRCLELGQKAQAEERIGQTTIFSAMTGAKPTKFSVLAAPKQWEPLHQLALEKKALGFFITGHPLHFYQEIVGRFANTTIGKLKENSGPREEVRLAGVIRGYKTRVNRRGMRFANLELEDLDGVIEMVMFSKVFEQSAELLDSEEPVFVRGTVDVGDAGEESAKIIANEVIRISEVARRFSSRVEIRLPKNFSQEKLAVLKEALSREKGRCAVLLRLPSPEYEVIFSLPDDFRVDPTPEWVSSLHREFGIEVAHLL